MSTGPHNPSFFLLVLKRALDVIAAASGLILLSPVFIAIALAVRAKLGAPIFFSQQRVGKDDRLFSLYKFRSMSHGNGHDSERLSDFGKWLRATSLDELPELWNVLKGDMSIVGPRPLLPDYLPFYSDTQRLRHRMRPGLTGMAQVKGRNAIGWEERLGLDSWYVTHWSLWLDIKIVLATFKIVLLRQGINAPGEATMGRFDDYVRARRH